MNSDHHDLDVFTIPKDITPLYINEPWLIDDTVIPELKKQIAELKEPEPQDDNIRVYVPLDLNEEAILRRLRRLISLFGEATEDNEYEYQTQVRKLIYQIEIYDQVWASRHIPKEGEHSPEAKELVRKFVIILEHIPDACAETFPYDLIEALRNEYLD